MKTNTSLKTAIRSFVVTGSLLAALVFSGALAGENYVGLTECDHGCKIKVLPGNGGGIAGYQDRTVSLFNSYESNEVGEIGITR